MPARTRSPRRAHPAVRTPPRPVLPVHAAPVPVSATLAANEALARRRRRGQPVLPLAFGEAGLPGPPALRDALAAAAASNGYGPVAGQRRRCARPPPGTGRGAACRPTRPRWSAARAASRCCSACCWPSAPTSPCPAPSWVSYAAQASLIGARPHFVPAPARRGRHLRPRRRWPPRPPRRPGPPGGRSASVVVTLPDNPTGTAGPPGHGAALCQVAAEHDLIIISDEIYRDLVHDPATPLPSPALCAPERTVVTTALSKSLALGGWRIGVARLPDSPLGRWPAGPAARRRQRDLVRARRADPAGRGPAFAEPPELTERIDRAAGPCTPRSPAPSPTGSPRPGCGPCAAGGVLPLPRLRAAGASTCGRPARHQDRRGPGHAACWTATASACCPAARSATPRRPADAGGHRACSTARPTSSGRRWPRRTR